MKCIVAGGTGLVGSQLVANLLKEDRVTTVASLVRSEVPMRKTKLNLLRVDFELLERTALPAADVAFCCLGTTIKKAGSPEAFSKVDHDYIIKFAEVCKNNGVKKFLVVSALGADPNSKIFYNKVKGRTEEDLKKIGFEELVIFQPSLLLGERKESRPAERIAQIMSPFLKAVMVGPLAKSRPIEARKVAEAMRLAAFIKSGERVRIVSNTVMNHIP